MPSVLITGASRGLGRELLGVYCERRWTVFPLVRDRAVAAALKQSVESECHPILGDVSSEDTARRIHETLDAHADSLDLLVNNAGNIRKHRGIANTSAQDLEDHFRVHCVGAFQCTKAALPYLQRAPKPIVVNITSRWGSIGRTTSGEGGGIYSYQIAKCAQNMLTACLDFELRESGIRVFAVHPGRLKTEVAAADADTAPRDAAVRLADWLEGAGDVTPCGCHDLMGGGLIEW